MSEDFERDAQLGDERFVQFTADYVRELLKRSGESFISRGFEQIIQYGLRYSWRMVTGIFNQKSKSPSEGIALKRKLEATSED